MLRLIGKSPWILLTTLLWMSGCSNDQPSPTVTNAETTPQTHLQGLMRGQGLVRVHQFFKREKWFDAYPLALSPDDRLLAFTGSLMVPGQSVRAQLRIVDAEKSTTIRTVPLPPGFSASKAAFSKDSRLIAVGRGVANNITDASIQIVDVARGKLQMLLHGHSSHISALAFSNDGRLLVSGSHDRTVRVWEVPTGKLLHTFKQHPRTVYAVAFSPQANIVFSGSYDGLLACWNLKTRRLVWKNATGAPVSDLVYDRQKNRLVSASLSSFAAEWNPQGGERIKKVPMKPLRHAANEVRMSVDASFVTRVLMGTAEKYGSEVTLVDMRSGQSVGSLSGKVMLFTAFPFSKSDRLVTHSLEEGSVLWKRNQRGIPRNQLLH